ncbi:MAG: NAD(P)H-hydrate epimerase [Bacteroidetes bacterium HGW-Bacteroidetes-9]|jgi:NAD(P)H-hydrate epimerase|nr:MAG: NAD(P)H-hydrate epimerase [Bacteroidetes bacterium HGW-Bacteroidetes-9]
MKFITDNGIEVPAVTTQQMIEIDRIAMEETGPNLYQMMENAGRNLCILTLEKLGDSWNTSRILVLAGTGGNSGGGICAARHLANHGADVTVCVSEVSQLKEVPAYQLHVLQSTSAKVITVEELKNENPDIILDAIIGYSLTGEPAGNALKLIEWASGKSALIISLDVPSGINSTTGAGAINHIKPNATLTLALPKTGLLPELSGELYVADIGIPHEVYNRLKISYNPPFGRDFYKKIIIVQ